MSSINELKDALGLPCFDNAQRLARLEAKLESISEKLDCLVANPCARCQNKESIAILRTEMRVVKWAGACIGSGLLAMLVDRVMQIVI